MFNRKNVLILTGPIQTGKTTLLQKWSKGRSDIGGILTPDVEGQRKLYHINRNCYEDFEANTQETTSQIVGIGKFRFLKSAFISANKTIAQDLKNELKYVIIDELGKLELSQKGLEPHFQNLLVTKDLETKSTLILVIRTQLLKQHIDRLSLIDPKVFSIDSFIAAKLG